MESLQIDISQGIGNPPQVNGGAIILRPTEKQYINQQVNSGKMSYAQNVNVQNDKYGREIVLPGPYLKQFTSTSPGIYLKAPYTDTELWFANGTGTTMDFIKNIAAGGTPTYDNTHTVTATTTAAGIVDMEFAMLQNSSASAIYVVFQLTSGIPNTFIAYFQGSGNSMSVNASLSNTSTGSPIVMIKTQFNSKIYVASGQRIDRVDTAVNPFSQTSVAKAAIGTSGLAIPSPWSFTALGEWNGKLVGAASSASSPDFTARNGSGQSRIFFWDIANNPLGDFTTTYVSSPSHYISVLLTDLSGNLLAFGGVDEGRTTIYQYNGYGFQSIFSYIGDMPRNRHSVTFDSIGRLVWVTADARICRYDRDNDIFDYLGVAGATATNGGILTNLQSTGYDFLVAGGGWLSSVNLGAFVAGGTTDDAISTPLAISGLKSIPQQSVIRNVTPALHKALEMGEKIEVRLYPSNYDVSTYTVLGSLDYSIDGAITSKNVRTLQANQTEFAIGYAWKTTATTTAPGILSTNVEYNKITTL